MNHENPPLPIVEIENLKQRVSQLPISELTSLLDFEYCEGKTTKQSKSLMVDIACDKFNSGEIDEIELLIIESGQ